jgi:peptidyl-dipeptidase Dcp
MQALAQEVSPLLSEHRSNILLNKDLWQKVKAVYEQRTTFNLDQEQSMLLDKTYKGFARNGALLDEEGQKRLRELSAELGIKSLQYGQNILSESNAFSLHITEEKDLSGLPESAIEAAAQTAQERKKEGWVFTLDFPSYLPFMTYADNRELREQMYRAFSSKANQNNKHDNKALVLDIVKMRQEKAKLLGYDSHADYILEERMAKSSQNVYDFLENLFGVCQERAKEEAETLRAFAQDRDGLDTLQKWDVGYYSEKLKQAELDFDEEKLKPYFQLENVIDGVFGVATKLFGLQFKERTDVPKYHKEVRTYEVQDEKGEFIALFYGDFFPRPGKRQGAWMTLFQEQYSDGVNHRPHVANVCNFTKPTGTKPSLLTFNEVTTLFHEFGHALHGMLANTHYQSLASPNVLWDFVELPSQLLENWCYEKECLDQFASHYETGELIPEKYVEQINALQKFRAGTFSLRQLSFGRLDMKWHDSDVSNVEDVEAFEQEAMQDAQLYPKVEGACMSTQFAHVFQGGYSAGYYSYKWAEVLEADAFEYFKEAGIFNADVSKSFKENILEKGGTEDPADLYRSFRGRDADPKAVLRRAGLL